MPASDLVPGVQLTHDHADGTPAEPVTVTAVEPYGDRLLFDLDNGLRMPFDPDEQVVVVAECAVAADDDADGW